MTGPSRRDAPLCTEKNGRPISRLAAWDFLPRFEQSNAEVLETLKNPSPRQFRSETGIGGLSSLEPEQRLGDHFNQFSTVVGNCLELLVEIHLLVKEWLWTVSLVEPHRPPIESRPTVIHVLLTPSLVNRPSTAG